MGHSAKQSIKKNSEPYQKYIEPQKRPRSKKKNETVIAQIPPSGYQQITDLSRYKSSKVTGCHLIVKLLVIIETIILDGRLRMRTLCGDQTGICHVILENLEYIKPGIILSLKNAIYTQYGNKNDMCIKAYYDKEARIEQVSGRVKSIGPGRLSNMVIAYAYDYRKQIKQLTKSQNIPLAKISKQDKKKLKQRLKNSTKISSMVIEVLSRRPDLKKIQNSPLCPELCLHPTSFEHKHYEIDLAEFYQLFLDFRDRNEEEVYSTLLETICFRAKLEESEVQQDFEQFKLRVRLDAEGMQKSQHFEYLSHELPQIYKNFQDSIINTIQKTSCRNIFLLQKAFRKQIISETLPEKLTQKQMLQKQLKSITLYMRQKYFKSFNLDIVDDIVQQVMMYHNDIFEKKESKQLSENNIQQQEEKKERNESRKMERKEGQKMEKKIRIEEKRYEKQMKQRNYSRHEFAMKDEFENRRWKEEEKYVSNNSVFSKTGNNKPKYYQHEK